MTDTTSSLIELVEDNKEHNYKLYRTPFTQKNVIQLKFESQLWHTKYERTFGKYHDSSTWGYTMYNLFQLTAGSVLYLNIYRMIRQGILDYLKDKPDCDNVWMGSWINYHTYDKISELQWHTHEADYHGYLSIDPKNSQTNFRNYSIQNQVGLLYIGPGDRSHEVQINEPFTGHRITIAFNLRCAKDGVSKELNISHIPLL